MSGMSNTHWLIESKRMRSTLLLLAMSLIASRLTAAEKPNVLVVLTDDQGWGDLSLNGNTNLSTPNIDGLAKDGTSFDRFYVCPVCSPTRAEFLTGRYHPRGGVYSTSAGGERLDLDESTIADTFKAGGYATGAFGKWHNGMQYPYHPNGRGFDEYYGFCSGHWGNYFSPQLEHNGKLVKGDGFVIDDFTNKAMDFMAKSHADGKPFFAYLPYNTPHSPMQVPARWWNKFKDAELTMRNRDPKKEVATHVRAALAMCENIDWNVGRLLAKLDELKIADNTIVIYFCDNGPNGVRWNGDMKGRKGSTDEGGVRSPMLIRWPGTVPAGRKVETIGGAIDLLPTLADMAGITVQSPRPLDGISLKEQITGSNRHPDRLIYSYWKGKLSARSQRFRFGNKGRLFELATDPGQRTNVAKQFPDVAKEMAAAVERFKQEVVPENLGKNDTRTFPLGHADAKYTQIPARDGTAHGGIKRSNRFPNCSYFTNWTATTDKVTWEVEVLEPGDYNVEMYYICPKGDVGSTVRLTCGNASVSKKITDAHDPPVRGAAEDRHVRVESYVKDFRPMSLGRIKLAAGTQTLTLQATEIPGAAALEFRLLMFDRRGQTTSSRE